MAGAVSRERAGGAGEGAYCWRRICGAGGGEAAHSQRQGGWPGHHDLRGEKQARRRVFCGWGSGAWIQPARLRLRQGIPLRVRCPLRHSHPRFSQHLRHRAILHLQQGTSVRRPDAHRQSRSQSVPRAALRTELGRRPPSCEAFLVVGGLAGRQADRGVLPRAILQDRVLAALVDNHGIAAAAQPHRVPALPEPLRLSVPRSVDHGACSALAVQPVRSFRQTPRRAA